jgi:hypothetical protein
MADPSAVNSQITDAVTQANVKVLGEAPAIAMGNLYLATSQALSNAAHNATTSQQNNGVTSQAASTLGVNNLYSGLSTALTLGSAWCSIQAAIIMPTGKPPK